MMSDGDHSPDWVPNMDGPFAEELAAHVRHRRALGHRYAEPVCHALKKTGRTFAEMGCDGTRITRETAGAWCSAGEGQTRATLGKRRTAPDGFAKYLISRGWEDVALCEEGGALGSSFAPHVLGRDEVARVFRAARASAAGERAHSCYAAMCLRHACGLRRSEAGNLRVSDFDPGARAVAAGHSKSDVSRLVAMSESTAEVLAEHAAMPRDPAPGAFLLRGRHAPGTRGGWPCPFWHDCLDAAGVVPRADGSRQRPRDLRHTFCVRAPGRIAEGGRDIRAALPLPGAYLGHKGIVETERYLRLVEPAYREVSDAAAGGLPDFYGRGSHGREQAGLRVLRRALPGRLPDGEEGLLGQDGLVLPRRDRPAHGVHAGALRRALRAGRHRRRGRRGVPRPPRGRPGQLGRDPQPAPGCRELVPVVRAHARARAVRPVRGSPRHPEEEAAQAGDCVPHRRRGGGPLASIDESDRRGLRDKAMLAFPCETAARVDELCGCLSCQLRLESAPYAGPRGKGGKARNVPVTESFAELVGDYAGAFGIGGGDEPPLANRYGRPLTQKGVAYVLGKRLAAAAASMPSIGRKRITCHSMRHSRATRLLEAGVNLIYIRDILGHASVTTTEIYAKTNPELKRKYLTEHSATYSTGEKYTPEERNDLVKWLKDNF